MNRYEKQFWEWVVRHRLKFLAAAATLFSLYARYALRGLISADMRDCLFPWYDAIRSGGGFRSLSAQVGDYNIPYQTLIAFMTCFPIKREYAYKILSALFDYALGAAVAAGVYDLSKSRLKSVLAYTATVMLPVTVLNSAAWGQCDSIYTFFIVAAFVSLMRGKHTAAFLLYGTALAFKLQAVFFLPFLLFYYVWSRKFSGWRFLLLPVPPLVLSAGGLLQGRGIRDVFGIYLDQTSKYTRISLNYPSFWNLLVENNVKDGSDHYPELYIFCMMAAVIALACLIVRLIQQKELNAGTHLLTAAAMMHICVLFLPAMHERYAYPVLIFAVFACFLHYEILPAALGLLIIDLQTYGQYLFGTETMPWVFLVMANILCCLWLLFITVRKTCTQEREENSGRKGS